MVQRGVELGMTESDTEVRNAILNSLVASVTAEADAAAPTDDELRRIPRLNNAERFSYTASLAQCRPGRNRQMNRSRSNSSPH